jgi:DNA glycosylase AlkZ-like
MSRCGRASRTGLREVVASLRPSLQAFRDEQGRELLDLADGALAAAETPAPPRFLPEYDNVLLSHADRSRVLSGLGPCLPFLQGGRGVGTLLVDGFYRANWIVTDEPGGATLTIDRFALVASDPAGTVGAIVAQAPACLPSSRPTRATAGWSSPPSPDVQRPTCSASQRRFRACASICSEGSSPGRGTQSCSTTSQPW